MENSGCTDYYLLCIGRKSAIKDAGRVLDVPIPDTNNIAKLIPPTPGMNIAKALAKYDKLKPEEQMLVDEMRYVLDSPDDARHGVLASAKKWKAVSEIQESMPVGLSLHRKM
jgi:GTP-binding protein EngB required for normal cell division